LPKSCAALSCNLPRCYSTSSMRDLHGSWKNWPLPSFCCDDSNDSNMQGYPGCMLRNEQPSQGCGVNLVLISFAGSPCLCIGMVDNSTRMHVNDKYMHINFKLLSALHRNHHNFRSEQRMKVQFSLFNTY